METLTVAKRKTMARRRPSSRGSGQEVRKTRPALSYWDPDDAGKDHGGDCNYHDSCSFWARLFWVSTADGTPLVAARCVYAGSRVYHVPGL